MTQARFSLCLIWAEARVGGIRRLFPVPFDCMKMKSLWFTWFGRHICMNYKPATQWSSVLFFPLIILSAYKASVKRTKLKAERANDDELCFPIPAILSSWAFLFRRFISIVFLLVWTLAPPAIGGPFRVVAFFFSNYLISSHSVYTIIFHPRQLVSFAPRALTSTSARPTEISIWIHESEYACRSTLHIYKTALRLNYIRDVCSYQLSCKCHFAREAKRNIFSFRCRRGRAVHASSMWLVL